MNAQKLIDTAMSLVGDDKGLLAMNESNPTCNNRFAKLGIPETAETRRAYRELIISTPGLSNRHADSTVPLNEPSIERWENEGGEIRMPFPISGDDYPADTGNDAEEVQLDLIRRMTASSKH